MLHQYLWVLLKVAEIAFVYPSKTNEVPNDKIKPLFISFKVLDKQFGKFLTFWSL